MISNVCLNFFGTEVILAHAKAWDLVLWMSKAFHNPLICFNFFYFHQKVNKFKTPEMCLYLHSDDWTGCFTTIFAASFHYFKPVSSGSCPVKMLQAFHNHSINFHCAWKGNAFKTPEMRLYFEGRLRLYFDGRLRPSRPCLSLRVVSVAL